MLIDSHAHLDSERYADDWIRDILFPCECKSVLCRLLEPHEASLLEPRSFWFLLRPWQLHPHGPGKP